MVPGGWRHAAVLMVLGVALLGGCGDTDESDPAKPATSASPTESAPQPTEPPSPAPTEPPTSSPTETEQSETPTEEPMPNDGPLAAAIADLSHDTGVDPDDIQVVVHEQVTWRDGSLGCPRPGMMYTQALVEGYRIVLRAQGEEVAYHGAMGKPPFRCDHPAPNGAIGP